MNNYRLTERIPTVSEYRQVRGGAGMRVQDEAAVAKGLPNTLFAVCIENAIPGVELQVIDNCGHFPFLESQEMFSKTVIDFLQQIK